MNQPGWGQYGQQGYQQPPPNKGMSGCVLAILIVGGIALLGFGGCVVCVFVGASRAVAPTSNVGPAPSASASASAPAASTASSGPTAVDVCKQLDAVGVATNCKSVDVSGLLADVLAEEAGFDLVGRPDGRGQVMRFRDIAQYESMMNTKSPVTGTYHYGSPNALIRVQMNAQATAAIGLKAKAVVDALDRATPAFAASAGVSVSPSSVDFTVQAQPRTTVVGGAVNMIVTVKNKSSHPIHGLTLVTGASSDLTWHSGSADLEERGLFATAKTWVTKRTIDAHQSSQFILTFSGDTPSLLTLSVDVEGPPEDRGPRVGEQKVTVVIHSL